MTGAGEGTVRDRFRPGLPFGAATLPDGLDPLVLSLDIGDVTALRAQPRDVSWRRRPGRGSVLLVPGFTGSKEDHLLLLPLLAARGWDAWAFSQRGQGDSVAPAGTESYRLDDFVGDTLEVTDLVRSAGNGEPVHLLGHSFGGVVARAAAIARPASFASLTMLCSGPHGWPGRKADLRDRLMAGGGTDLWRLDNPDRADVPDADLPDGDRFLRARSERTATDNLLGAISILADPADSTDELRGTGLPVLVAHGEADSDAWPQEWQASMARRLSASYAVIDGAGHLPNLENPTATADLLDSFWTSVLEHTAPTSS